VHPDILGGIERDQAGVAKLLVEWFWGPAVGEDVRQSNYEQLTQIAPDVLLSDFEVANAFDIRDRLKDISTPTLILVGSEDQMTPPRSSQYLEQHIEGARLVQFDGAGHKLPLEQPEAVAEAVAAWLDSQARS
jgi:pimeloyl-ACP methyl ester carboxylesterase